MRSVLILFFVSSTIFSQQTETIQGGSCFQLQVPSYFIKTFELNEDAILQYYHPVKDAYWLIIDQDKTMLQSRGVYFKDVKDYIENLLLDFQKNARNRILGNIQLVSNQEVNIAESDLSLTDNQGKDLVFYIAVIETKDRYYKFYGWTSVVNKSVLLPDFQSIVQSFKQ
ncbi:MAG: hypothetical protein ACK4K1_08200 [Flavobacterium sp.]